MSYRHAECRSPPRSTVGRLDEELCPAVKRRTFRLGSNLPRGLNRVMRWPLRDGHVVVRSSRRKAGRRSSAARCRTAHRRSIHPARQVPALKTAAVACRGRHGGRPAQGGSVRPSGYGTTRAARPAGLARRVRGHARARRVPGGSSSSRRGRRRIRAPANRTARCRRDRGSTRRSAPPRRVRQAGRFSSGMCGRRRG